MAFTNAVYTADGGISVEIDGVPAFVPNDTGNSVFSAIMALVEAGDLVVAPYVAPPPAVPQSVTPRQVRLLLLSQNLLSQVEAMIAASDEATKITWEFASEFRRDDPLLEGLAQQLGLSNEQIDQFFIAAAVI